MAKTICARCSKDCDIDTGFCQECMDNVQSVKDYMTREDQASELLYHEWLRIVTWSGTKNIYMNR